MRLTLFRKQLLLTAIIMVVFVVLGLIAAFVVGHFEGERLRQSPFSALARLVDTAALREHLPLDQALAEIARESQMDTERISLEILTSAQVEASEHLKLSKLPKVPYEALLLDKPLFGPPRGEVMKLGSDPDRFLVIRFPGPGGAPPSGPPFFAPPPPGEPPPFAKHGTFGPRGGPPPFGPPFGGGGPGHDANIFLVNFIALIVSVVLGSAVSLGLFFYSMREKARLADEVISALQAGDLKKRFPVKKLDEAGVMMEKFNKMADEIEHLVDRLKTTELARTRLLQELAHDLRTPVASLKNVLETLQLRIDKLSVADRTELLALSVKETEYFENLVEDLLFIAQVTDPRYRPERSRPNVIDIVDEELTHLEIRGRNRPEGAVAVKRNFCSDDVRLSGDPHLLRRLFRNAIENAVSFARKEVCVTVEIVGTNDNDARVRVLVRDDGPGLSPESLAAFGEKRGTRAFTQNVSGRLSVGLGSVIMKAVTQAHHGSLSIANVPGAQGISGAEVVIELPVSLPTVELLSS